MKETISAIEPAMENDTIDGTVLTPLPIRTQKEAAEEQHKSIREVDADWSDKEEADIYSQAQKKCDQSKSK